MTVLQAISHESIEKLVDAHLRNILGVTVTVSEIEQGFSLVMEYEIGQTSVVFIRETSLQAVGVTLQMMGAMFRDGMREGEARHRRQLRQAMNVPEMRAVLYGD